MAIIINGIKCETLEELNMQIDGLSDYEKQCVINDFNNLKNEPPSATISEIIKGKIEASIIFGNKMIQEFATDNVLLGITQAGKTKAVRIATSQVVNCLMTGSLYDAIAEAKAIPSDQKDPVFINDVRLLQFINKIETFLGIPLSTSL